MRYFRLWLVGLALGGADLSGQMTGPEDSVRLIRQARMANDEIRESSGLVASRRWPGVMWTLNDSGNLPRIYATDSLGRDLGTWQVAGAENRDWEALTLGRCGRRDCLLIADVGDNLLRRKSVRIYLVEEPSLPVRKGRPVVTPIDTLEFSYDDGPRNVEAIFVAPNQDIYLVSKERSGGGRVYLLPAVAWSQPGIQLARFVQELPFPDGLGFQVTDAALAPEGSIVAIRTYRYIYFFRFQEGRLTADPSRPPCDAGGLDAQGEGITWIGPGGLATTSERVLTLGSTVSTVECR